MPPPVSAPTMSYSFTTSSVPLRSVPLPPQGNGRAKAHATSVDRPSKDNSPHMASPPTQDFYLDSLFNPIWISGPNVFSFNNDGTVLRPKTCQSPFLGHYARKPSRYTSGTGANQVDVKPLTSGADSSPRHNPNSPRSYADAAESSFSNGFPSKEKAWKNVAITKEDEAAFEAIQAKKWVSGLKETRAAEEAEFVYTSPPVAYSQLTDEHEAPQLSYASSADTSDSDEEFSIPPPDKRGDRVPFKALQEPAAPWDDGPLENVVLFERLRSKAPPPLTLQIEALDVDHSESFLFGTDAAPITATHGFLSPLMAIPTVNSQLSATLLRGPYSVA